MSDDAKVRFLENVKDHSMDVELDSGVFRSIKFSRNNSSVCYFRITTWPGHLCISGDMGTYVFARLNDMFEFFRGDELTVNVGYWTEKLQSISCFGSSEGGVREFDAQRTYDSVKEYAEELGKEEEAKELLDCSSAHEALRLMDDIGMQDAWEYLSSRPTFHILWCLYAIRWAIMQYDKPKEMAA
jgi:hypothetical protein